MNRPMVIRRVLATGRVPFAFQAGDRSDGSDEDGEPEPGEPSH